MAEYDETTYGERIAEVYDLFYGKRDNSETDSILLLWQEVAAHRQAHAIAFLIGLATASSAVPGPAIGVRMIGNSTPSKLKMRRSDQTFMVVPL